MRTIRLLVVALAALLVAQLAPAAVAADTVKAKVTLAVVDDASPYASLTLICQGIASTGATATTVYCEVWDSNTTSISHVRIFPGGSGACWFKSNQMILPIGYCATAEAQFVSGSHASDSDCHAAGAAEAPPQPPSTTARTLAECVEPMPIAVEG
jgi:hypothetical protein